MTTTPRASTPRSQPRRCLWLSIGVLVLVGMSTWIRWPGFTQGGFGSHDVGGILYNAMVLQHGGLPYVDTVELKAPGTFYLAAAGFAGQSGNDIATFQIFANSWAIVGLVALTGFAWRLWGTRAALTCGALYALHDAFLDSLDGNYVTWAALPQILTMFAGFEASQRSSVNSQRWLWATAGLMAGFAALLKQPAGIVLIPLAWWALWGPRSNGAAKSAIDTPAFLAVLFGFASAHIPISLHYETHGHFADLWLGYVFNPWGEAYVGARDQPLLAELWEGVLATTYVLTIPSVLAIFSAGRRTAACRWLSVWVIATIAAAFVGFRFYKGYYLPVAAPLCLLAAAPWGLLGRNYRWPQWSRAIALLALGTLLTRQVYWVDHVRDSRSVARDKGARRIAEHVAAQTDSEDRIWIWGWHLWGVYALADRLSASRIYKSLGLLTPPNDNTWRRRGTRPTFVPGPAADILMADLETNRPAYIVLGSTVPRREFKALRTFLRAHYRRDRTVKLGRVQFWRRR